MSDDEKLGGSYTLPGTTRSLHRLGYGAMQLAGPGVWGPPADRAAAIAVLHEVVQLGINHIDTSDYYGPHITNQLIREALHPYPANLTLVTKVGSRRGPDKSWPAALSKEELTSAVHDNLRNLRLDSLNVVNLRVGGIASPQEASIAEPLEALAGLQAEGLIQHIGLSNVNRQQFEEAERICRVVCVQNHYNLAHRSDDPFLDELEGRGIPFTPFFPLGGFTPLQSSALSSVAASLQATPMQTALAWLLQRSPNILLIPGTSSVEHLQENVAAAELRLSPDAMAKLNGIGEKANGA